MKKQLRNIVTFFLAAAVLFASTGVVIASHVCTSSKKSDISLFQSKDCCSKKGKPCTSFPTAPSSMKKNCCQLDISYHKIDVSSVQKTFSPVTVFYFPVEEINAIPAAAGNSFSDFTSQDHDIVSGGKPFLYSVHTLLI